jgi:hypothetical protein
MSESYVIDEFSTIARKLNHQRSFHSNLDSSEHLSVPTLHVLFAKSLSTTVLPRVFPDTSILSGVRQLRGELIHWIADEALEGDLVAAEWVLLAALSRV